MKKKSAINYVHFIYTTKTKAKERRKKLQRLIALYYLLYECKYYHFHKLKLLLLWLVIIPIYSQEG